MSDNPGPMGCILDPAETDAVCFAMRSAGQAVWASEARPELAGQWQRERARGVRLVANWTAEERFYGRRPADFQKRGTCVGRGTYRAVQDSYLNALFLRGHIGNPRLIAYEPIYRGSRVVIGKGRIGGDGSVGAWAASWLNLHGANERRKYGAVDLTSDNESWACSNSALPAEILAAAGGHKVRAFRVPDVETCADVIASRFSVAWCRGRLWGKRGADGFARPAGSGNHCECIRGVLETTSGGLGFVVQQSWGNNNPSGPDVLRFGRGDAESVQLPFGAYGVYAEDVERALTGGWEMWAFQVVPGTEWRE